MRWGGVIDPEKLSSEILTDICKKKWQSKDCHFLIKFTRLIFLFLPW